MSLIRTAPAVTRCLALLQAENSNELPSPCGANKCCLGGPSNVPMTWPHHGVIVALQPSIESAKRGRAVAPRGPGDNQQSRCCEIAALETSWG